MTKKSRLLPPPRVKQFGLYLDDVGILRCKGRLNNADLPITSKNPVLLPSKNDFVNLMIKDVHHKIKHSGMSHTLTTLRESYWILWVREATKRIIKHCIICRKLDGVPFKPQTPDLPDMGVVDAPPFTFTCLDFAGPLYITSSKEGQANEVSQKAYICLYTCASTRAIHLELLCYLSVKSFLQSFRRFASRRGLPSTLLSDNAKTFKAGSKEVKFSAMFPITLWNAPPGGGILGKADSKCEKMPQENSEKNITRLRWTEYRACWNRVYY